MVWQSDEFRAITDSDRAVWLDLLDRSIFAIRELNHLLLLRTFTTAAHSPGGGVPGARSVLLRGGPATGGPRAALPLAGVTPQMLTRILRRWERAGIVRRTGPSGLELLDRAALEAEAAPLADFPEPRF